MRREAEEWPLWSLERKGIMAANTGNYEKKSESRVRGSEITQKMALDTKE